jgi:hypothetical protein
LDNTWLNIVDPSRVTVSDGECERDDTCSLSLSTVPRQAINDVKTVALRDNNFEVDRKLNFDGCFGFHRTNARSLLLSGKHRAGCGTAQ